MQRILLAVRNARSCQQFAALSYCVMCVSWVMHLAHTTRCGTRPLDPDGTRIMMQSHAVEATILGATRMPIWQI